MPTDAPVASAKNAAARREYAGRYYQLQRAGFGDFADYATARLDLVFVLI